MRIGPLWIGSARHHEVLQRTALHCLDEHLEGRVLDFGGVKIARELVPHLLRAADGACVLTRDGKRLRLRRDSRETFVVTEIRG